jgi:dihydrodipicolinate synthase/N-acetylneuraminate lyase
MSTNESQEFPMTKQNHTMPLPVRGIIPPLVTPLKGPDQLDVRGLERLIEHVLSGGCSGLFVLGSTGEAQALSCRLRQEVIERACELTAERVPVLVGITDTAVAEAVRLGNAAAEAGASAVVTAPPYYFRLSQADLLRHTEMLTRQVSLPLFLYNMPQLTKLQYEPETVLEAASIPGVVGLKDSSGDLLYLHRVLRLVSARPDFTVLIGPEELLAQAVLLGAHGGVCGGANAWPELYVQLCREALRGDVEGLRRSQKRVVEISERIYRLGDEPTSYTRGLKCALGVLGICSDLPAPPLAPISAQESAAVRAHLDVIDAVAAQV